MLDLIKFSEANGVMQDKGLGALDQSAVKLEVPIIQQYWQLVLRWKWVILAIIASSLVVGLVSTLLTTPEYTATSRIEISREQDKVTKLEAVASSDSNRDLEFYQTQYALLRARVLAERVSRALRLSSNNAFLKAVGLANSDALAGQHLSGSRLAAALQRREKIIVNILLKNITVSPVRGSSLVDVSFTSTSPAVSAQIADAWVQEFIGSNLDRRFASTADARKFLEGRLNDLRAHLEQSEAAAVNYSAANNIVPITRTISADGKTQFDRTIVSSNLDSLNAELSKATADRIAAASKEAHASSAGATQQALGDSTLATLRQRRAEVAADYAKLLVQFEPAYPAAKALSAQLSVLDANIAREEQRVSGSRFGEYREALAREQALAQKVASLTAQLNQQQRSSIQYNIYLREADTTRQLYDSLLQRYKEVGVAGVGSNNIAIVDTAKIPDTPSSPNLSVNLGLALLIGVGLAIAAVIALNQINDGLRVPSDVGMLLHVPLLGSVPDVSDAELGLLLTEPKSSVSEAYLSIRSNLALCTDHGVPRSLMLTSTRPSEGKTTSAIAMATVLGRIGKRVLLIDGDMRNPSLHRSIGIENSNGLSNYLAGDNDWKSLITQTTIKGVSVLTSGPKPPSAAELLSSDRMGALVGYLQEHFDHVLIDTPPIMGLADAPLLSRVVEGSIFVIEAEGVSIRGLRGALGRLRGVQSHILGAIITKLNERQSSYGYGYGYGYGYDYGKQNVEA